MGAIQTVASSTRVPIRNWENLQDLQKFLDEESEVNGELNYSNFNSNDWLNKVEKFNVDETTLMNCTRFMSHLVIGNNPMINMVNNNISMEFFEELSDNELTVVNYLMEKVIK